MLTAQPTAQPAARPAAKPAVPKPVVVKPAAPKPGPVPPAAPAERVRSRSRSPDRVVGRFAAIGPDLLRDAALSRVIPILERVARAHPEYSFLDVVRKACDELPGHLQDWGPMRAYSSKHNFKAALVRFYQLRVDR